MEGSEATESCGTHEMAEEMEEAEAGTLQPKEGSHEGPGCHICSLAGCCNEKVHERSAFLSCRGTYCVYNQF